MAFALLVTAVIFGVATIANDNLQDLKTGQLVEATPWRQQVALILGVDLRRAGDPADPRPLEHRVRLPGRARAPDANALAAPQAALISAIAQGVLGGDLDWNLIGLGAAHRRRRGRSSMKSCAAPSACSLPPLAVGMGMYLPMALTLLDPDRCRARLCSTTLGRADVRTPVRRAAWVC